MISLRLAFRNLHRNRRRTLLTSIALSIGLTVLVISRGFLNGADRQSIDNLIKYDLAHGKVFLPGYRDEKFPGFDYLLENSSLLENKILENPQVKAISPRLTMTAMLIKGSEELPVSVTGIDPLKDVQVFDTFEAIVAGKAFNSGEYGIVIGDKLARDIKANIGDVLTLLVKSKPGALNPKFLPVVGIVATGHPQVDQFTVFLPLDIAREMAFTPDAATEIALKLDKPKQTTEIFSQLQKTFPDYEWYTWKELSEDFLSFAKLKKIGTGIMISILSLLAAVGVANTMLMSVHERTREIGTLKALGFSPGLISRIFILEGSFIGILSAIAAVILGLGVLIPYSHYGMSLAAFGDMDIGYPLRDAIYPEMSLKIFVQSFIFGIIVSTLASWGAARLAAKGQVVKALREGML